jgi:hypothetical protein
MGNAGSLEAISNWSGLFPHDLMAEVEELNRDFIREREAAHQEVPAPNHRAAKFPRVHVEVREADAMGFPGTEFVLHN